MIYSAWTIAWMDKYGGEKPTWVNSFPELTQCLMDKSLRDTGGCFVFYFFFSYRHDDASTHLSDHELIYVLTYGLLQNQQICAVYIVYPITHTDILFIFLPTPIFLPN